MVAKRFNPETLPLLGASVPPTPRTVTNTYSQHSAVYCHPTGIVHVYKYHGHLYIQIEP